MLRLNAGSRRLSGSEFQVDGPLGPQQQNNDDQNCSDDNAERLTSADWRTADADDPTSGSNVGGWCTAVHQTPGTAEPFHEETGSLHQHGELESYSVCDVEPMELVMQPRQ